MLQELKNTGVNVPFEKNLFKYIIHTKLGDGPKRLADNESLLNDNGLPNRLESTANNSNAME